MRIMTMAGLAGAATAALLSFPAAAQDVARAPFSGVYVGGSVGFDAQPNDGGSSILFDKNLDGNFGDSVRTAAGANAFSPGFCKGAARGNAPAAGCNKDKDGVSYYGRVGFDYQRGPIVLGAVGEFGKSEITDSVSAFSTTPASYTLTRKIDWEGSARGRIGYAANTTLFYGTAGGGYARMARNFSTTNTANAFAERGKREQFGLVAGGGLEQKISPHLSFGLEYLFHRYRDADYRVRASAGSAPATNPFILAPNTTGTDFRRSDPRFQWHSVHATAAYRF